MEPEAASPRDREHLEHAVSLALAAEAAGNLPVGAVIALDGEVVAEGANAVLHPAPHPGRHAEVLALAALPASLASRLPEMTCYSTLEPCVMCFGALVLHRVGRVVFGASDPVGGAVGLIESLPDYVRRQARKIEWVGPAWREVCDPLAERVFERAGVRPE